MQPEFFYQREQKDLLRCMMGKSPNAPPHFHSPLELYFILEGEMEVWINEHRRTLQAGEISVVLSYDAPRYRTVGSCRAIYLTFSTDYCEEFLAMLGNRRFGDPFVTEPAVAKPLFAIAEALMVSGNELQRKGNLYLLLGLLLEQVPLVERPEKKDADLATRILLLLNKRFKEECSLTSLAGELGYHPGYLSRFFKENFHVSLNRYIAMLRLREAVLLMKDPRNSVSYCAFESGFPSIRTFYSAFTEEFHCSPRAYRESQGHT